MGDELAQVRQELATLSHAVHELKQHRSPHALAIAGNPDISTRSPSNASRDAVPKHPQFVGPTRPAYGLMIAERSLNRMGIPSSPSGGSAPGSPEGSQTDAAAPAVSTESEFWAQCTPEEAVRLISVFEEEVESVYPYTDIMQLASRSEDILRIIRMPALLDDAAAANGALPALTQSDIDLAKIAVAIGIAIEAHGKNVLCSAIAATVEEHVLRISQAEVSLKNIQLLITLVSKFVVCCGCH